MSRLSIKISALLNTDDDSYKHISSETTSKDSFPNEYLLDSSVSSSPSSAFALVVKSQLHALFSEGRLCPVRPSVDTGYVSPPNTPVTEEPYKTFYSKSLPSSPEFNYNVDTSPPSIFSTPGSSTAEDAEEEKSSPFGAAENRIKQDFDFLKIAHKSLCDAQDISKSVKIEDPEFSSDIIKPTNTLNHNSPPLISEAYCNSDCSHKVVQLRSRKSLKPGAGVKARRGSSGTPLTCTKVQTQPFSSLKLAKRRHYTPSHSAVSIQKRTGSKRPQGRPFTSQLDARFFLHHNIEDLFCSLLNTTAVDLLYLQNIRLNHNKKGLEMVEMSGIQPSGYRFSETKASFRMLNFSTCSNSLNHHKIAIPLLVNTENHEEAESLYVPDVHKELCKHFQVEEVTFVKVLRDSRSKIKKIETFRHFETDENFLKDDFYSLTSDCEKSIKPDNARKLAFPGSTDPICSPQWVKKNIAYPRYKSKMKIHLLPGAQSFIIYNDPQMYIWDLKTGNLAKNLHKHIILNNCYNVGDYFQ